jgi:hypothetical protein
VLHPWHILRAGRHIGIFLDNWEPTRNYRNLEQRFVDFAEALNVPAPALGSKTLKDASTEAPFT